MSRGTSTTVGAYDVRQFDDGTCNVYQFFLFGWVCCHKAGSFDEAKQWAEDNSHD